MALLRVKDLNLGPPPSFIDHFSVGTPLFVIAHRGLTGQPTVYPPGIVLLPPAEGHALARLHHDASGGDGSDGGAVLTEDGRLAGIATVGNVRRSEAIPAAQIRALIKEADASFMQRYVHAARGSEQGRYLRTSDQHVLRGCTSMPVRR